MKTITILIPCYNEEKGLEKTFHSIKEVISTETTYQWNILFVNDGSTDNTLQVIKSLKQKKKEIEYISLSRNFGKEAAMLAGFDYFKGDGLIIIDADLQDPPTIIPEMIRKWEEGYMDVYGKRRSRGKESFLRKTFSMLFYKFLNKASNIDILPNVGDFRLLDKKCIEALKLLRETERYTKGMFAWIGFKKCSIEFDRENRSTDHSKWNFHSLSHLAINGITSFTSIPLRFSTYMGFFIAMITFIYLFYFLIKTIIWGDAVTGFPTLIIVILFLGSIQLISLGIIGEYISKIYNETKDRPIYIIQESSEDKTNN